jgi:hypothetical protein
MDTASVGFTSTGGPADEVDNDSAVELDNLTTDGNGGLIVDTIELYDDSNFTTLLHEETGLDLLLGAGSTLRYGAGDISVSFPQ